MSHELDAGIAVRSHRSLPKLCGADIELGNFIVGADRTGGTGAEASRALLREIEGVVGSWRCEQRVFASGGVVYRDEPQDWGRKFLPCNGGCVYVDLDHLELCLPEVLSAYDHVACWHAMLRIARAALR